MRRGIQRIQLYRFAISPLHLDEITLSCLDKGCTVKPESRSLAQSARMIQSRLHELESLAETKGTRYVGPFVCRCIWNETFPPCEPRAGCIVIIDID